MTKLTRKHMKVFASNATNNGVFGSLQANNPTTTTDIEAIQSLPAWELGWNSATETSEMLPPLEEAQAINYVNTYQIGYLFQEGTAEWNANTTYYTGSWVKSNASGSWVMYESLIDDNTNNSVTDDTKWEPKPFDGGFVVGDIKTSLQTANHGNWFICNGQAISRTTYNELFDLIGTTYGSGDGSTTFNLPDFTNIIQPTTSNVDVKGNGITMGFTNGTETGGLNYSTADPVIVTGNYGSDIGTARSGNHMATGLSLGLSTDETKSGIVGQIASSVQLNYFIKVR